jgi:hypothetical protein
VCVCVCVCVFYLWLPVIFPNSDNYIYLKKCGIICFSNFQRVLSYLHGGQVFKWLVPESWGCTQSTVLGKEILH